MKYEIILYWSETDDAFIAEIPELPGCMADGKTMPEALQNVQIVAQEWIETARELGREIPVPKGRLQYAESSEIAQSAPSTAAECFLRLWAARA